MLTTNCTLCHACDVTFEGDEAIFCDACKALLYNDLRRERNALREDNAELRKLVRIDAVHKLNEACEAIGAMMTSVCRERDALWELLRQQADAAEKIVLARQTAVRQAEKEYDDAKP